VWPSLRAFDFEPHFSPESHVERVFFAKLNADTRIQRQVQLLPLFTPFLTDGIIGTGAVRLIAARDRVVLAGQLQSGDVLMEFAL
jgi:hypothetical protein